MKPARSFGVLTVAVLAASCGSSGPAGHSDPFADYGLFLNVLTPGQADCPSGGQASACPDNFTDQQRMYENLVFTRPGQLQTVSDLVPAYFKTEAFVRADGTPPAETRFVSDLEIGDGTRRARLRRDSFGVPYIYGDTRADVMFGTGYASAEDRLFVMDVLRHVGRGRQSDFIGAAEASYTMDRDLAIKAGYDEGELQAQGDQLPARFGAEGSQALVDVAHYIAGVNRYIASVRNTAEQPVEYAALQLPLIDFTPRDVVAIATLVQAIFAVGGGNEVAQVRLLHELREQSPGASAACQLWRDLRHFDDPEKPTTADERFETQSPATLDENACPFEPGFAGQFPGAVMFDRGSFVRRDPLTIEDCFAVAAPGQPACPNYRGDVTDDSVSESAAALRTLKADARGKRQPGPAALRPARQRALDLIRGINLALSQQQFPGAMSNALLVNADQTAAGYPIAVFGPQTGYFAPQLLLELNQMGGDIFSRGTTFAGLPYVVIGRGIDHAWSATSSGDDIIDVRVLRLCNADGSPATPASTGYLYRGECRAMFERIDEWTAEYNAGAPPPQDSPALGQKVSRRILRAPDYGPVFGTATVNGAPVALAVQRSTYFGEVDSAIPFVRTSRNRMTDPQSFFETFNRLTGTFNWFYINAGNIAYFNSGLLPVRAAGVHPDLPQWGDGSFDWKQANTGTANPSFSLSNFLPLEAHPRQINPAKGYMTSWNNAQAPGFWAAEHQSSYGPVHRSQKLDARLKAFQDAGLRHTPASMVEIMEDAGATDLRGQEILPAVFAVLGDVGDLSAAQQQAVANLKAWVADGTRGLGAQRRDRDGPGQNTSMLSYKDRDSVILMDRWWHTMIDDALPQIRALETSAMGNVMIEIRHDAPGPVGSAFIQGYYGYMRRVLDMARGASAHPYRRLRCAGTGALDDCRSALVASLQRALDMTEPVRPEEYDAIVHTPVGAASVPNMHWINRPTWQQVIQPTQRRY